MNTIRKLETEIKKLKGNKAPSELPKTKREKYTRLNDRLRYHKGKRRKKNKPEFWLVTKDTDAVIFKKKGTVLYGITPEQFDKAFGKKSRKKGSAR